MCMGMSDDISSPPCPSAISSQYTFGGIIYIIRISLLKREIMRTKIFQGNDVDKKTKRGKKQTNMSL